MRIREEEVSIPVPVARSSVSALVTVQNSPVAVIATHPWGPLGGSMHDPHPTTVCRLMAEAGCSTARFNFRSGINFGGSSIEDVKAVADWFTEPRDGDPPLASQVLLVGYSYGSLVAAAAASEIPRSVGYAVINPPVSYAWALYLFNGRHMMEKAADSAGKPKLLMIGTEDVFCSVETFQSFVDSLPEPKTAMVKDGVDHFSMYGHLRGALTSWITAAFGVADLQSFARSGAGSRRR
mmetsp:Transcript_67839/g.201898  ORF Transcript_67839/g.201898 Transcript_67839/m.201898 type:complete len:237 (+) Transcript_67839:44-754(+)